jgi:hypothetical protein
MRQYPAAVGGDDDDERLLERQEREVDVTPLTAKWKVLAPP